MSCLAFVMDTCNADLLLGRSNRQASSDVALENLAAGSSVGEACAGSVAARGVMWANAHPAPKRWLPLKGPAWFTVHRALQLNQAELRALDLRSASH